MSAMRGAVVGVVCALSLAVASPAVAGAASKHGGTKATTTTTLNQAAATPQVTAAFVTLFNSNDKKLTNREQLIQSASKYKSKFVKLFSSTVAKANPTVAQVTAVTFPGTAACKAAVKVPVCAAVTYNIDTATTGATLLAGQTGYAVYVGGKWLVSNVSFCALAKLAGVTC